MLQYKYYYSRFDFTPYFNPSSKCYDLATSVHVCSLHLPYNDFPILRFHQNKANVVYYCLLDNAIISSAHFLQMYLKNNSSSFSLCMHHNTLDCTHWHNPMISKGLSCPAPAGFSSIALHNHLGFLYFFFLHQTLQNHYALKAFLPSR